MKLLFVLTVTLAFALAEDYSDDQSLDDLQASASVDLQKAQQWTQPTSNRYVPAKPWVPPSNYQTAIQSSVPAVPDSQNTYFPIQNDPPQNSYYQPQNNYNNPAPANTWDTQNSYNNNQNTAQNTWNNPQTPTNSWSQNQPQNTNNQQNNWNNQQTGTQNTWNKPQNTGSQNTWTKPQNTGTQNTWNKPQNTGTQNTWNKPTGTQNTGSQNTWTNTQTTGSQNTWTNNQNTGNWNNWNQTPSSTTTQVSIIKNEQSLGENGSYKYEYETGDGTHVAEEGFLTNPNTEAESIVKKGFYSYKGSDGKVYSVTYWADETGFHAVGDHLPKPPAIPPAIQASIDQNAREEAAKAEAEKNKQQQQQQQQPSGYYPQGQEPPKPIVPQQPVQPQPQQPTQYPQQTYYPTQQQTYPTNYYPPQASGYGRR